MAKLSGYGKVWALGHQQAQDLLDGEVVIQEKVDGSQFSFGNLGGELHARSKGQAIGYGGNCEGMFAKAMKTADLIFRTGTLPEGMVVRGECLDKPRHNTIAYERVPVGNIIIWDISENDGSEIYLSPTRVEELAKMWGLEIVPTFYTGPITKPELGKLAKEYMDRVSILGKAKIEGIVIKNYKRCDAFGKMLSAKIVSEDFKE